MTKRLSRGRPIDAKLLTGRAKEMIALFPLVVIAAAALVWRRHGEAEGRGSLWFAAWCAAGALFTLSFLAGLSIGVVGLPFAAGALLYVAWRSPHISEGFGSGAGIGATLLLVALLNRDYRPCPEEGLSLPASAPPGTSIECGGFDPTPWLLAGVVTAALARLGYGVASLRRRDRDEPKEP
jgi:hypothetical protein